MDYFTHKEGVLHAEDIAIPDVAADIGTPFYCYSTATLQRHFRVLSDAFANTPHTICFAVKANSNLAILKVLADMGSGADVVSEGEIRRALAAGIAPEKIVFSGVGKTASEMRYALEKGIFQFNVESEPELQLLSQTAIDMSKTAAIAIRVNPDVEAGTHAKISTGKKENKFGIPIGTAPALYAKATSMKGIAVQGVSMHIGSQLTSLDPFRAAFIKLRELVGELRTQNIAIHTIDVGGGLGVPYEVDDNPPTPAEYAALVHEVFDGCDAKLLFEPGRVLVANAGVLVSRVIYMKPTETRNFAIVDVAMNDLMRPSLYGAYHEIIPVEQTDAPVTKIDVVGPVCETGDTFAEQREMPLPQAGDLLAFRSAGAYGAVISNSYNTRPLVPEILVDGGRYGVVRARQDYDTLLKQDSIPDWMA